jgi:hypothetical protein
MWRELKSCRTIDVDVRKTSTGLAEDDTDVASAVEMPDSIFFC